MIRKRNTYLKPKPSFFHIQEAMLIQLLMLERIEIGILLTLFCTHYTTHLYRRLYSIIDCIEHHKENRYTINESNLHANAKDK
jgi:hypothetical protein